MSLHVRDSGYNLLEDIRKGKREQAVGAKIIHKEIAYSVTYECYCEMTPYQDWMKPSLFPCGFLFRTLNEPPSVPTHIENEFKFKVDGWVVTSKKTLQLVTLVINGGGKA